MMIPTDHSWMTLRVSWHYQSSMQLKDFISHWSSSTKVTSGKASLTLVLVSSLILNRLVNIKQFVPYLHLGWFSFCQVLLMGRHLILPPPPDSLAVSLNRLQLLYLEHLRFHLATYLLLAAQLSWRKRWLPPVIWSSRIWPKPSETQWSY